MSAPVQGNGTVITFSSSFFAQLLDCQHTGVSRASISKQHMGTTGGIEFDFSSAYDPGELRIRIKCDPATLPPITGAVESVTVNHAGSADTWTCQGALTSFDKQNAMEGHVELTGTIKLSGDLAVVT